MADSLDDFFAKKDRLKKAKGEKGTTGDVSKKQDDSKMERKAKAEKPINIKLGDEDDGDWKEINDEPDFSGLKIHSLTIKDKEEELKQQKLEEQHEQMESKKSAPWKSLNVPVAPVTQIDASSDDGDHSPDRSSEQPEPTAQQQTAKQAYVPPHLRNKPTTESQGPLGPTRMSAIRGRVRAPEIENQMEFPSLGDAPDTRATTDSGLNTWRDTTSRPPIRVENKYDALRNSDK